MEWKQLRHFVAVAEEGGVTAAARRVGMTQPALSRQMQALEEELGVTLLDRGARSMVLTPAAEVLLADARRLLAFHEGMVARVRAAGGGLPLRIGYSPSLAGEFLPAAIGRFTQMHPGVRVSLHDSTTLEMRRHVLEGRLDVMVAVPCGPGDGLEWHALRECGWVVATHAQHRLAGRDVVTPRDLDGENLLLFERDAYPDYWAHVSGYLKEHAVRLIIGGDFDGVASLIAAVEANLGVAVLAETTRFASGPGIRIPLRPQPAAIPVAAGVRADHQPPPHVLAFIEELRRSGD